MSARFCPECDVPRLAHVGDWLDALVSYVVPQRGAPARVSTYVEAILESFLVGIGLMQRAWGADIPHERLVPRDRLMVEALMRAEVPVSVLVGPGGPTTHISVRLEDRTIRFDGLPTYEDLGGAPLGITNNKTSMKEKLAALGAPIAESRTFWFWQRSAAARYAHGLGRVAVKPERGTMDRHVSVDVAGAAFTAAFAKARRFGPRILVEAYMPHTVARITVVGGETLFAVRYESPAVVGDGMHTVEELIVQENASPERKDMSDASARKHHLVLGEESEALLSAQGESLASVPAAGKRVQLRRDPFIRNGSGFRDITTEIHPDIQALTRRLAKGLNACVVGIDCIAEDFSRPVAGQSFVVLEANPVPFIDLHATPERPREIADAVVSEMLRAVRTAQR